MKVRCYECMDISNMMLLRECNECDKGLCDNCITVCSNCDTPRCSNHSMWCSVPNCGNPLDCCAKLSNYRGGGVCVMCGSYLCGEHLFLLTKEQKQYYKTHDKNVDWNKTAAMWQKIFCEKDYKTLWNKDLK